MINRVYSDQSSFLHKEHTMQATDIAVTRPLEYYRQERVLTVAEFAKFLGITEQTYRRLLREPQKVRMETRRQVLQALGPSPPHYVRELAPPPTPETGTHV